MIKTILRKGLFKAVPILVLIPVLIVVAGCAGGSTSDLSSGSKAPDFELYDLSGNVHKLSDYEGTPVLLNFWATWCGPCRSEMPYIQEIFEDEDWSAKGLVILGVNIAESASQVE